MAHAISRLLALIIALVLVVRTAAAVPDALVISETPSCRVSLTKLSYDGPGADDDEFIELVVERFATDTGGPPKKDAGPPAPACNGSHEPADAGARAGDAMAPSDARADVVSGRPTLGDCGLGELRLINGGGGACDEYRTIPLGSVAIPDDGYVVLCAQDSVFSAACDVDTAGRSALRNGFLQNGPTDGLRFVGVSGAVALEVGYEGAPACLSPSASRMVDETGEAFGAPGVDDVNVVCSGRFELRAATEAPFRGANPCRAAQGGDSGVATPSFDATSTGPKPNVVPPEFAPDSGTSYQAFTMPDAAVTVPPRITGPAVDPPSCGVAMRRRTSEHAACAGLGLALASLRRRRLRRPRALRADCSARCGTGLRRSP
jgi:hypothetical protein